LSCRGNSRHQGCGSIFHVTKHFWPAFVVRDGLALTPVSAAVDPAAFSTRDQLFSKNVQKLLDDARRR